MAYASVRFSLFSTGQTGAGLLAKYDSTGTDGEGGDAIGSVKGNGFFTGREVRDAVRKASDGRTGAGVGLPIILAARDGLEMDVLYDNSGTLQMRGGNWNVT